MLWFLFPARIFPTELCAGAPNTRPMDDLPRIGLMPSVLVRRHGWLASGFSSALPGFALACISRNGCTFPVQPPPLPPGQERDLPVCFFLLSINGLSARQRSSC